MRINAIEKAIEETEACFEVMKKPTAEDKDAAITIIKDGAPEALCESMSAAHWGDRLPDDWVYDMYRACVERMMEYECKEADDIEEHRAEIVDGLVDIYTSALTAWLNRHPSNVEHITEAISEYGNPEDGIKLLQMAQYRAIDAIYGEAASYIARIAEDETGAPCLDCESACAHDGKTGLIEKQ